MKISVLVTAYNHEKYIAQALDSVLMQQVTCDVEIVVGEDASTDRTREIILDYERRYPGRIRVLLRDRVDAERERALGLGGKTNFMQTLKACDGQYVALLDADDYWTDVRKLQKQFDFMESNPDFAICFHNVTAFYEDGSKAPENLCPPDQAEVSTVERLLSGNFIPSCSAMFRGGLVTEFPDWYSTLKIGDWPLYILEAQHGKIRYLNKIMGAYRVHRGGTWSLTKRSHQDITFVKMLDRFDRQFEFKYRRTIAATKARYYFELSELYFADGHPGRALVPIQRGLWCSRFKHRGLISLFLQVKAPALYDSLRSLRDFVRPPRSNSPGIVR